MSDHTGATRQGTCANVECQAQSPGHAPPPCPGHLEWYKRPAMPRNVCDWSCVCVQMHSGGGGGRGGGCVNACDPYGDVHVIPMVMVM